MITFTITNKHRPKATIVMLISLYGKQYKKSIGVGVPVKYWNEKKKCAKVTADFDGNSINDRIGEWEVIGKRTVKYFTNLKLSPTQEEFVKVLNVNNANTEKVTNTESCFVDYYEAVYIPRYKAVKSPITVKKYHTVLNKLREFEADQRRKIRFADVNIDFYNQLQLWFYGKGFSANYFGLLIKTVKQVFREASIYDKLHSYNGIEHKDFITVNEQSDSVYLSVDELNKIYQLDITPELIANDALTPNNVAKKVVALRRARGLFLIGCYTGLRVSDFSRLKEAHIGKHITIKTTKTGANVVIPIHPVVKYIIDSGFDFCNTISDQKLNEQIKELCRLAGITGDVMLNKNVGGKNVEVTKPKYKLISSHTARRSFATNAYKASVPTIAIMKITGHKKESTFLKYIKVSEEENADILSRHQFFQ